MSETRVAVVGAGKMGALHARVFAAAARLVGVVDVDAGRAERVARAHDAPVLRGLDEAIERAELVVIATPTSLHFEQARRAVAAGRAVLVEKPLAAAAALASALAAAACAAPLLVGHSERFDPVVRALAARSRDEEILAVRTRRTAAAPNEDLCVNLAVHDIDLAALLARAPVELVTASGGADEAEIVLRAAGAQARASVARGVARRVRAIRLDTSRATYEGDLVARRLARQGAPVPLDDDEPLALQARAALAAMRGEPSPIAQGVDGLRAVEIAELAAAHLSERVGVSAAE